VQPRYRHPGDQDRAEPAADGYRRHETGHHGGGAREVGVDLHGHLDAAHDAAQRDEVIPIVQYDCT
jgi:hypothetical protein